MQADSVWQNAVIPLASPSGEEFTRTGSFYVQFSAVIDALTKITVTPAHQVLVEFEEGRGLLDLEKLTKEKPDIVDREDDPATEDQIEAIINSGGYIRFFNLPRTVSKSAFSSIAVSSSRVVARPSDYAAIAVKKNVLTSEAYVPLIAARSSASFTDSGSFFTGFSITADATLSFTVPSDTLLYSYEDGVTHIDVTQLPDPPSDPPVLPHSLTITGLPATAHAANFLDVFIHNSAGVVAKCADYTAISITSFAGKPAAVIPLVYDNNKAFNGQDFSDSGNFIVSFSFFSDALESITVTPANNCITAFLNGSGLVDAAAIPQVPHHWLTITGLPPNTQALNVTDVFIWNQAGKIGRCEDYSGLLIQSTPASSTLPSP
jgi:hypothetical protein